ncbi:MAG: HD domain-containing phosphohydrolase [Thermoleophilia bacterium]|jgi:putative nucleotidyltransferase with HDIG domain
MSNPIRILMLEDSPEDAELVVRELRKTGMEFESVCVSTRAAFLKELEDYSPDLILSDFSLPSYDGFTALEDHQRAGNGVPFIFVSGKMGEETAIEAMKRGATDYVLKQRLERLKPAVERALREVDEHFERMWAEEKLKKTLAEMRKAMGGVIQAFIYTVESRDPYTAGHQQRVADLARSIAKVMGLDSEQIEAIRMGGSIHDLGKIQVPAEILSKPGRLTPLEFEMIKLHPKTGYEILKDVEFPWGIARIVLQHHERLDGSGYPYGVSGEDIDVESRIIAVADVVEAMSSHRPYRPALGIEKALEEIVSKQGCGL